MVNARLIKRMFRTVYLKMFWIQNYPPPHSAVPVYVTHIYMTVYLTYMRG